MDGGSLLPHSEPRADRVADYLKLIVLLSLCSTERVVIRPLMTVRAMMLFSPTCVVATTRQSSCSLTPSAPVDSSEMLRLFQ